MASRVDASPRPATQTINRWLIPVGAVAVHICIGSVYAWSTFNRPFQALLPNAPSWFSPPYTTYSTALVILGLSAAFGGPWVERRGPRVAATAAALLFGCGLLIGGIGLALRQSILVFLGMGVIGGMGCGLGYIAPVSTLVKWFPDRRGMATGMAIMGFGGGAAVASPLNVRFMASLGVPAAVMTLAAIYLVVMLIGALILRRPPEGWKPEGWNPSKKISQQKSVTRNDALGTPQFYLLWAMLFINVTAGIGILAQASPIVQDLFQQTSAQAATFVLILSIFNLIGRFFWACSSDYIGRRNTYSTFFVVQVVLFLLIPGIAGRGEWAAFLASVCVVVSMYGGGFATIPAFLADIFGPNNVGAIHGVVLTAWSAAAIAGPVIVTELSNRAKAALAPGASHVHISDDPPPSAGGNAGSGLCAHFVGQAAAPLLRLSTDTKSKPTRRSIFVISLKQSIEEDAEHLLRTTLDSYHAALNTIGEAAAQACPAAGEDLQSALQNLSAALANPVSEVEVARITQAVQDALKSWAENTFRLFQQSTEKMQDVLLMAGMAAEQVGERDKHYTKRFTEFTERLQATSKLGDVTAIRQSLGQHTADLKSYVAQMVKDSDTTIAQLRAQIAAYESKLEEMEHIASEDPLTGLSNRRKVERHIETRIRSAKVFSVISLDLNGFKKLNDTYGHLAGDDLLSQFATELRTVFRAHDIIGRVGGDEFIVLVDGDLSVATARLERIRRWVNGSYAVKDKPDAPKVNVTAAAGAAQWNPGQSMRDVLGRADAAMYADKPRASFTTLATR